jgi:hypothetical protein
MPLQTYTINPGAEENIDANPVDSNGNPSSVAPGSTINWVPQNGSVITCTPAAGAGLSAQVAVAADAAPGTYQVDCQFQAVAFGPTLTSSFDVIVPQQPAVALVFALDATQP